jgi:phage tail tape-measure protein
MDNKQTRGSANRDPISGTPGAHPVGTGIGAAAGGVAAGAAVGTVAGPIGTAVGAAVGAVLGGLGGKAVAENFDPTIVDDHWRDRYDSEPYYADGMEYDDYAPAYQLGAQSRLESQGANFDELEDEIATQYDEVRGTSRLDWNDARHAARASWYTNYL